MTALQVIWFALIAVLLTVYAILDGFDMGVGFWHLFTKKNEDRRVLVNSIGPVWDGNEVWLLTGGGAIFAAFPHVYATVFSGFYMAFMILLVMLTTRAVSLEFRHQVDSDSWRRVWDVAFAISSTVAALLFAVALGNILRGIPLDETMTYTGGAGPDANLFMILFGGVIDLLNPYALVIGLTGLAMIIFQGATFIVTKSEGELNEQARGWVTISGGVYLALYLVAVVVTIATQPHLLENANATIVLWAAPLLPIIGIAVALWANKAGKSTLAFVGSSGGIAGMWILVATGLFPRLVPALNDPALSLTVSNSSSSELTLTTMLVLTIIGLPLVLVYTAWSYKQFWGPVDMSHESNHY